MAKDSRLRSLKNCERSVRTLSELLDGAYLTGPTIHVNGGVFVS
jgi:hypothetical protein